MKKAILIAVVAASLAGCARMQVMVDVLDPAYARQIQGQLDDEVIIRDAQRNGAVSSDTTVTRLCTAYQKGRADIYDAYARVYRRDAEAKTKAEEKTNGLKVADGMASTATKLRKQDVRIGCVVSPGPLGGSQGFLNESDTQAALVAIQAAPDAAKRKEALDRYKHLLTMAEKVARDSLETISQTEDINLKTAGVAPTSSEIAATKTTAVVAQAQVSRASKPTGYLGDRGKTLTLSDLAHAASSAPPNKWQPKYNVAEGFGAGGSTDMVIRLNDTADFSVKGLVFDARSTAVAVRKATASTVQILASGAGLNLKVPENQKAGTPEQTVDTTALTRAKVAVAAAEKQEANYRAALRTLAASFLSTADVTSTTTGTTTADVNKRKAARKAAKDTFDAFKPQLAPETPAPTTTP